nr:ras-related protein Rab-39B-like [Pocillopora verrucosa]XP_058956596.1 ras-related protein Rab-39B-like [Pocillopora verrucosa]
MSRQRSADAARFKPKYFYQFRIILIGDSTVGKSSLLRQFTEGQFIENSDPTVGVDFHVRVVMLTSDVRIKLQIWDTAGQERFRAITYSYYRNTVGCLIVYDITNRESFLNVKDWYTEAKNCVEESDVVFMLIGHKIDKESMRKVSTEEGERFAEANNMMFIETSAKVLCNIEEAFFRVTEEVHKRMERGDLGLREGWDGIKALPMRPTDVLGIGHAISAEDLLEHHQESKKCCMG